MEMLSDFKVVTHDWDDTVKPTFNEVLSIEQSFAHQYGYPIPTAEQLKTLWGRPLEEVLHNLYPGLYDVVKQMEEFTKNNQSALFPGVCETLQHLRGRGFILGVVSSGPKREIDKVINANPGLQGVHHFIHGAEDCLYHKPDPRAFDLAFNYLNRLRIAEKEVLYIGDHLKDYKAARARGMSFMAVLTGFTEKEDFLAAGLLENQILNSFSDLINHL